MKNFKILIGEVKEAEFLIRCFFIDVKAQFIEVRNDDVFGIGVRGVIVECLRLYGIKVFRFLIF